MRKSEKEIKDRAEIDSIINRSRVCRLGMSDNGLPYIVPLSFGYDGKAVYFHCAREGRKIDIIKRNNAVCLEFDIIEGIIEGDKACDWWIRYQSVIATGLARIIEDNDEKRAALAVLMSQYSNNPFYFPDDKLAITCVIGVEITEISGKQSKRQ